MKRYDNLLNDNADKIIGKYRRSVILLALLLLFSLGLYVLYTMHKSVQVVERHIPVEVTKDKEIVREDSILCMATAFAIQETKCNDVASPCGKYVGYLQMSEQIVKECNRIVGKNLYKPEDRHDWETNIEMFTVIMERHNPELDIDRAIDIWNKYCPHAYRKAVKNYYKFLLLNN